MAAVSEIDGKRTFPAPIRVRPHHGDHCFGGRAVLPAVEAMAALAATVREHCPDVDPRVMADARFDRFAFLPPSPAEIDAFHQLDAAAGGQVRAELMTRQRGKISAISRTKIHASLVFGAGQGVRPRPLPRLPGQGFKIAADRLYRDLVPFGQSFQSLFGDLVLSESGAVAPVRNREGVLSKGPLGDALVLDGAFHAACAWGQRHAGIVAFPVGFARRRILAPAVPGDAHEAHVFAAPAATAFGGGGLIFDIQIYNGRGLLCEVVEGLEMCDVSRGRLRPPAWVRR